MKEILNGTQDLDSPALYQEHLQMPKEELSKVVNKDDNFRDSFHNLLKVINTLYL